MRSAGWTVDYIAASGVMHHIGASRGHTSRKVILERHRGMIHYFRKHHPTNPIATAITSAFIMLRARLMLLLNDLKR